MSFDSDFGHPKDYRTDEHPNVGRSNNPIELCTDSRVSSWHPDYSLSSSEARQWHNQNKNSRHDPLRLNHEDGSYTVQRGDCLSTIAARELRAAGRSVSKKSIDHEVKQIVALNRNKHRLLDYNKEYLEPGWKIRLPRLDSSSRENSNQREDPQKADDSPGQSHRRIPHASAQHHHRYHQAYARQADQQQQHYSPRSYAQSPDVGQGIANVLGSTLLGGIGGTLLGHRGGYYGGGYGSGYGGGHYGSGFGGSHNILAGMLGGILRHDFSNQGGGYYDGVHYPYGDVYPYGGGHHPYGHYGHGHGIHHGFL